MTTDPGLAQPIPPPPPPPPEGSSDEALRVTFIRQDEYSRLLPLVKWLLVIPQMIVFLLVAIVALFAHLIAFIAVVITRKYPTGLFNFNVGVQRWGLRIGAYYLLMTDRYPPFSLADDPDYPARLEIDYPADGTARWRPFFAGILIYPYLIVGFFVFIAAYFAIIIAFFAILFTKRFPEGLFNLVSGAMRWQQRANAYSLFLTTKYPPWRLRA
jgi:ABC-type multidrug transport system fused ATPase/permease subunit